MFYDIIWIMVKEYEYIKLKEKKIPIVICKYKNAKSLKVFFRDHVLKVTIPYYVSKRKALEWIQKNEEMLYQKYQAFHQETFLYHGIEHNMVITEGMKNMVKIENNVLYIFLTKEWYEIESREEYILFLLKKFLKQETKKIVGEKLEKLSQKTGISYDSFCIRDSYTRFGSCNTQTKKLNFNLRLAMLEDSMIEAVIVHELCHIVYPNHSPAFYNLVKTYIPDYEKIDQKLKALSLRLSL